jgi:hypothetical protein
MPYRLLCTNDILHRLIQERRDVIEAPPKGIEATTYVAFL